MADPISHEEQKMNKISKMVGFIHISSICLLIIRLVIGCVYHVSMWDPNTGETLYTHHMPIYVEFYLDYINPAIYLLTLLYFVVFIFIIAFGMMKNKKNDSITNNDQNEAK